MGFEDRSKDAFMFSILLVTSHILSVLQENVVIVDSPGIGESTIMDDIVKEYLPEAFTFIYVINSENAGGVQRDRVRHFQVRNAFSFQK